MTDFDWLTLMTLIDWLWWLWPTLMTLIDWLTLMTLMTLIDFDWLWLTDFDDFDDFDWLWLTLIDWLWLTDFDDFDRLWLTLADFKFDWLWPTRKKIQMWFISESFPSSCVLPHHHNFIYCSLRSVKFFWSSDYFVMVQVQTFKFVINTYLVLFEYHWRPWCIEKSVWASGWSSPWLTQLILRVREIATYTAMLKHGAGMHHFSRKLSQSSRL